MLAAIALVGACGQDHDRGAAGQLTEASLPGAYAGVFPCDGCPGIPTTLWLRPDGRFFFEQQYPADEERDAMQTYSLGRWSTAADRRTIRLDGAGPQRLFERVGRDTLAMRTASNLEYRLVRNPAVPEFAASIRMAGMMQMLKDGAVFAECLTGLAAPVSRGGDFGRFRHQYRSAGGQREQTYVEFEGRFSWAGDGSPSSVTIDRFISIRADRSC